VLAQGREATNVLNVYLRAQLGGLGQCGGARRRGEGGCGRRRRARAVAAGGGSQLRLVKPPEELLGVPWVSAGRREEKQVRMSGAPLEQPGSSDS